MKKGRTTPGRRTAALAIRTHINPPSQIPSPHYLTFHSLAHSANAFSTCCCSAASSSYKHKFLPDQFASRFICRRADISSHPRAQVETPTTAFPIHHIISASFK